MPLRVRVLVGEGEAVPRIYVGARSLGDPLYWRSVNTGGESPVVLEGLGPGSFYVTARPIMGSGPPGLETELVLDGESGVDLELDLR